jgi:hypothetical protein
MDKEVDWRIKSKVVWLELGDNNTKLFHSFTNHRWIINTIWELDDQGGTKVIGFKDLSQLGVSYFEGIYKEPKMVI